MTTPSLQDLTRVFGRIGLMSLGGPAAQIALMHKELVEDRPWLSEQQFLGALSFCMLLPGPEAMQLATYAGWRLRGTLGGLIAGLLFVLPGALVILALALGYAQFGQLPLVQAAFGGIKAAVVVIVVQALHRVARRALTTASGLVIAALAFVGLYALSLPFPALIAAAALWGYVTTHGTATQPPLPTRRPHTLRTLALWGALWAAPLVLLWAMDATFLTAIALFFAKLAVVTFGGAYAVLAYMAQTVVQTHGWLTPDQMIDALGLAETTPGPLILVTEFVGLLAGFEQGGLPLALAAGAVTLWMTFTPCFLWIFAGAPYVERILAHPRLAGALQAITAAVVGVILNLSLWFALHVLFARLHQTRLGLWPDLASFDALAAAFTALAAYLLLARQMKMLPVLGWMAAAGVLTGLLPG